MTKPHDTTLAERFEQLRPGLVRLAYGELGSLAEAEDVVQEAWLRLQRVDADEVRDLRAWLTTAVSRLALDTLRSARVRREAYVGPWLPEPLVRRAGEEPDPAERAAVAESVGLALLVVLESLSASERVAFVLHDVFGYEFERVADVLGTTAQSARQHASRARRAVEARRPRYPATPERQREVVDAFLAAAAGGDIDALMDMLHPEVVMTADSGGVLPAPRRPIEGAERVARAIKGLTAKGLKEARVEHADVNGMPGLYTEAADGTGSVISFTLDDGVITAIDIVRNPSKIRVR
jgi:RNA polymerase sigma-70 factor (ECF subfamily)